MVEGLHEPYAVGTVDMEWSCDGEEIDSHTHLVGRFFYPADFGTEDARQYRRPQWLPSYAYARGYGDFLFGWTRHWSTYLMKPLFRLLSMLIGRSSMDCHLHAPMASTEGHPFPVIVFSHGIGGTRYTYSALATQLASAGFVVFSLEHADGSASTVRLAGTRGYKYYTGWGTEDSRMAQTRYRVAEAQTAKKLLKALNEGTPPAGLHLLGGQMDPGALFKGQLDLDVLLACGHSYGGATVTALGAEDPDFKCVLALDPWWGALPESSAALTGWGSTSPLLVMGSHDWNVPNANGVLKCGGERQERILRGTWHRSGKGGGAVLLVLEGSSHDTFSDVVALFGVRYKLLLSKLGFKSALDPALGLELVMRTLLSFLYLHLPLTPQQRQRLLLHSPAAVRTNQSLIALVPASPALPRSNGPASETPSETLQNGASREGERSREKPLGLQSDGVSLAPYVMGREAEGRVCLPHVVAEEEGLFLELDAGHVFKLEVAI